MENLNVVIGWVVTFIVSIGVVSVFLKKYAGKAKKAISVAKESLDVLDTVLKAIEDNKVDEVEVSKIREEANALMAAIKALKS